MSNTLEKTVAFARKNLSYMPLMLGTGIIGMVLPMVFAPTVLVLGTSLSLGVSTGAVAGYLEL